MKDDEYVFLKRSCPTSALSMLKSWKDTLIKDSRNSQVYNLNLQKSKIKSSIFES